jgi:polyisoprenoid-binding protein YceI
MRVDLSAESRVLVDLRASGLLRAVGHDPTLTARPEAAALDLDGPVVVRFPVRSIEAPRDVSVSDGQKMVDNLRSKDVLDAARFPSIELRARFEGDVAGGKLAGELLVRGGAWPIALVLRAKAGAAPGVLDVAGAWEGKLTDLGIKPFKALLGALTLKDWLRLRVEARVTVPA